MILAKIRHDQGLYAIQGRRGLGGRPMFRLPQGRSCRRILPQHPFRGRALFVLPHFSEVTPSLNYRAGVSEQ